MYCRCWCGWKMFFKSLEKNEVFWFGFEDFVGVVKLFFVIM